MARAQLHELKMTPGTMAEDYMTRFELLADRTGFNDAALEDICLGNDRGTGNTMCFWPGVRWGTGAVLYFETRTLTITSTGFYVVFGLTPDGVEARKFEPVPYPSSCPALPAFYFLPTCLGHTLTDALPHPAR